jgi:hypothetical protein
MNSRIRRYIQEPGTESRKSRAKSGTFEDYLFTVYS